MLTKLRRYLTKPGVLSLLALFFVLLFFVGFIAVTQESGEGVALDGYYQDDFDFGDFLEYGDEDMSVWEPPGPPRWFRSNAGGMALEEIPSRLAASRNKYAMVIDYVPPDELESRLQSFYHSGYIIEVHILYEEKEESRRQWLFRDDAGNVRLNAVFRPRPAEPEFEFEEETAFQEVFDDVTEDYSDEEAVDEESPDTVTGIDIPDSIGFIELYDDQGSITGGFNLFADGSEILTAYIYNKNMLVRTETRMKSSGDEEYHAMYTDIFRYNRSYSLRNVERLYHAEVKTEPIRLLFPSRVLDAASDANFMTDNLSVSSDFLGGSPAEEDFRTVFETDLRGRVLIQTMLDNKENVVWTIENTWSGDRIVSITKTEGDEKLLTEYEYNRDGDRVVQRDIRNGVLERQVHIEGNKETEELFLDGVVVLKAYWEDGVKINEERIRR